MSAHRRNNTEPAPTAPANMMNVDGDDHRPAGKPIPQAVLVYHESAHSIVFRDGLRRQQGAIRQASSLMERSASVLGERSAAKGMGGERVVGGCHGRDDDSAVDVGVGVGATRPSSRGGENGDGVVVDPRLHKRHSLPIVVGRRREEQDAGYESGGSRGSGSSMSSGGIGVHRSRSVASRNAREVKPQSPVMRPAVIANFQPVIEPLEPLDLNASNIFEPLLHADPATLEMTDAESEVVELLRKEQAVVKTIRNADWSAFLQKFKPAEGDGAGKRERHPAERGRHNTSRPKTTDIDFPFNSFVTSTSLLPSCAKKMRCFGSTGEYAVGVVFALPAGFPNDESEDDAAKRTLTWSWPSGYSAKTEFNIDDYGNLINGREEALVSLSGLRKMNNSYLHDKDYIVGGRMVHGGLTTIPYNEVYVRVGGLGRISGGVDVSTGRICNDAAGSGRSFDLGIGLPVALFVREADFGHLVRLLRTRARYSAIIGFDAAHDIPLLYITPERGVRVFTQELQHQVLKVMARDLNPFQNPMLAHKTSFENTSEPYLRQKLEELLDLDDDNIKGVLTPEEMARIAGGFGATDESVAKLLDKAVQRDRIEKKNNLQDIVNEGLAFALRANDYHTSRQLLILYTLVAAKSRGESESNPLLDADEGYLSDTSKRSSSSKSWRDAEKNIETKGGVKELLFKDERTLGLETLHPPPPPPLDTDRLRSATNSDGLLAVLGAAQVLRAMQDKSAKRRVSECIDAMDKWIQKGEQSVAFRVAAWRDQRAAQGDLKIAMENDSNMMAFLSNKAIDNRKKFVKQLRDAAAVTDFDSLKFLKSIHSMLAQMNSPCLRLELLQYVLGLDNRYSIAHVSRSVELAATCLSLSESEVFSEDGKLITKGAKSSA